MSSSTEDNISVSAIKASFLQTQTRLLSAPLHISATYRSWLQSYNNEAGSSGGGGGGGGAVLSDKQLAHLQKRVSDRITQHGKAVFSSQSIGHVAEQIETLYWNQVRAELRQEDEDGDGDGEGGYVAVEQDVQLTDEDAVAELPETLAEGLLRRGRKRAGGQKEEAEEEEEDRAEEARRYVQLRARLAALAKQRSQAQRRLQRYQRLQGLLRAYRDPKQRIQPNLVTTAVAVDEGEMRRELERTRALLVRVKERRRPLAVPTTTTTTTTGEVVVPRVEARNFKQKLHQVVELG